MVRVGARNRPKVIGLELESRGLCGGGWLRLGTLCLCPLRATAQQALEQVAVELRLSSGVRCVLGLGFGVC